MFYLRKVHKDTKTQSNMTLGDFYTVTHKDSSPEQFNHLLSKTVWMTDDAKEKCFCIVAGNHGDFNPLFYTDENYIVTERGSTYEKIM